MPTYDPKHIVIAGASGFVGRALIEGLLRRYPDIHITALARRSFQSQDLRLTWKACDLFSLKSVETALPTQIDAAYYLVHSMGPTAALDQGSFADYDLILADNFARALSKHTELTHIVYLGGLLPNQTSELSLHLQSRKEVEDVFLAHGLPLSVFRAGLILGEGGSSFQILLKLVRRLPVMICPKWTQTLSHPALLEDVVYALTRVLSKPTAPGSVYDLASCQALSYLEMMRATARALGLSRRFIAVPFFSPTLSRLWLALITGAPKTLVYPLIASLKHPMLARTEHAFPGIDTTRTYESIINTATQHPSASAKHAKPYRPQRTSVRSIQRLPLPPGQNAQWVRDQYFSWLSRTLWPLIRVSTQGPNVSIKAWGLETPLLTLTLSRERSHSHRQLLYLTGGILCTPHPKGRLEFREVLGGQAVLAAIHDYQPRLPWYVYTLTQALVHLWIMRRFETFLRRECLRPKISEPDTPAFQPPPPLKAPKGQSG